MLGGPLTGLDKAGVGVADSDSSPDSLLLEEEVTLVAADSARM